MNPKILLSIVTPTRGNFSAYWLDQLLKVEGNVQFVLVYPPGVPLKEIADKRVKSISSPYKGEMMQRFLALLNADGQYVLALDDDDFVHPEIAALITEYFQKHPENFVLRLMQERIDWQNEAQIQRAWEPIPTVGRLCAATEKNALSPVPIAPLNIPFDKRYLLFPFVKRKDDKARHIENFNTKVWRNEYVKKALPELSKATKIWGVLTWIPNSGFDRLMGLFLQACFFQEGQIIGHAMPQPAQIRFISQDPKLKPPRYHFLSDFILVKAFPQYGYFWNLFFHKTSYLPRLLGKSLVWKLQEKQYRS